MFRLWLLSSIYCVKCKKSNGQVSVKYCKKYIFLFSLATEKCWIYTKYIYDAFIFWTRIELEYLSNNVLKYFSNGTYFLCQRSMHVSLTVLIKYTSLALYKNIDIHIHVKEICMLTLFSFITVSEIRVSRHTEYRFYKNIVSLLHNISML